MRVTDPEPRATATEGVAAGMVNPIDAVQATAIANRTGSAPVVCATDNAIGSIKSPVAVLEENEVITNAGIKMQAASTKVEAPGPAKPTIPLAKVPARPLLKRTA